MIEVPVSYGELIDKITILEIKSARIADDGKLANIRKELALLEEKLGDTANVSAVEEIRAALFDVNEKLWDIEDAIRDCEHAGNFGPEFVKLARAVYVTNDERAELKRKINIALDSAIIEEKSYKPYKA
jgi:hypothetical protein